MTPDFHAGFAIGFIIGTLVVTFIAVLGCDYMLYKDRLRRTQSGGHDGNV